MESFNFNNAPKFKSPQEELEFLRAHIAEKERVLNEQGQDVSKEKIADNIISEYRKYEPEDVLHKKTIISKKETEQK